MAAALPPRRRLIASLLLLTYLPACTSWRVVGPSPAEFLATNTPRTIRVTRSDGVIYYLTAPTVRGDSVFDGLRSGLAEVDSTRRFGVPLGDVRSMAVRKFSPGRTAALVGGILVGFTVVIRSYAGREVAAGRAAAV